MSTSFTFNKTIIGMKELIIFAQKQLNNKGLNAGSADGLIGPKTIAALSKVSGIEITWEPERKIIAFIQLLCKENRIETGVVDGLLGPKTQDAYEKLVHLTETGKIPEPWRNDTENAVVSLPEKTIFPLQNYKDLVAFYGEVGTNQTKIQLPYPNYLSWELSKKISNFSCHEKVHDSLFRVLTRVLEHYGQEEISRLKLDVWGGCLSVRQMRGGTDYSMHSWGIAIDYDPVNNQLKWNKEKASFAKPDYNEWWKIWEDEGWVSLGRAKNYDWMHVQAARLK